VNSPSNAFGFDSFQVGQILCSASGVFVRDELGFANHRDRQAAWVELSNSTNSRKSLLRFMRGGLLKKIQKQITVDK